MRYDTTVLADVEKYTFQDGKEKSCTLQKFSDGAYAHDLSKFTSKKEPVQQIYYYLRKYLRLGLGPKTDRKKRAHPARVADVGQENIGTVHEPKPIQTAGSP